MLPDDWRDTVTQMVAGKKPLDGALFQGGPVLGPKEQIGVYARQYRIRLYEALEEEVIGLRVLLGDDLKSTLWAYLDACPSQSWTLERVAVRLEGWLRETGAPIEQVEMAALDRAVQAGFIAGDGTPLSIEELATFPPLTLAPHVQLLRLTTNVHDIRSAIRAEETVPLRTGIDVPLIVFRNGHRLQHLEFDAGAWALLKALRDGASVMEGLEGLVERGIVEPETIAASVQSWFKNFAAHQLVQTR